MATAIVEDQARAGDDLRLHALLRRLAVTVEHREATEGGIDREIETAEGIERQQRHADRNGDANGRLDVVAMDVGKQATHQLLYSRNARTD